jgi:transposase
LGSLSERIGLSFGGGSLLYPRLSREGLDPREQQMLASLRAHCSQLDRLAEHVTSFAKMMTARTGRQDLPGWLQRVEADDQPELHSFAAGIRQDLAAVTAGLTLPYSSGPTEGNVNRL